MTARGPRNARATPEVWARGRAVALVRVDAAVPLGAGVAQALRDGIERGTHVSGAAPGAPTGGDTPALPSDARAYRIEVAGSEAGVLALRLGWPQADEATVVAIAIDPARRGRSYGMHALLLAERALTTEGVTRCYAVVPRTNGRGLYFMLRCGYAPLLGEPPGEAGGDVTWFGRVEGRRGA